jgi:purine nucleoside phosphorylase
MSGRLAVVGGHSILGSEHDLADRRLVVEHAAGLEVLDADDHVVLQRHGLDRYTPAHLVDHARNVRGLAGMGCDRILALSSVGALRPEVGVGSLVVPDDFIALDGTPSVFDDERGHRVPTLVTAWRRDVVDTWSVTPGLPRLHDGGVYWQTRGPRFETPAEVRYLARFADVVGMTIAAESIAAAELGLEYAAICVVDNLANGVGEHLLSMEEFEAGKRANRTVLLDALAKVVPALVAR